MKILRIKVEEALIATGSIPVDRCIIGGHEVFIADGFSKPPHLWAVTHGALEPGEFPDGCHVTWYMIGIGESGYKMAAPYFFDKNFNISRSERIFESKTKAEEYIKTGKMVPVNA